MNNVKERFLKYVSFSTQSDSGSSSCPSTQGQFVLGEFLVEELKELGLKDVKIDENGYVTGVLPANTKKVIQTVGFIAHMDTSPDMSGENVNPQIIENYKGDDIILNKENNIVLSPSEFPKLKNYIGNDIVTTDGTTLLGADDKAGVAEIVTAMEYLIAHPDIEHGDIKVGFTPDEEIGRGADKFDVEGFNADFAYTIDGGEVGELEYENFNAAFASIEIQGRNVHPGTAKNTMINSMSLAMELHSLLPVHQVPEATENYEGFFHLINFDGSVEKTSIAYIIRDHDMAKFEEKKELMTQVVEFMNKKYGNRFMLMLKDSYYNMREKIEPVMYVVELARKSMEQEGIKPLIHPIRGGTDGARLSYMGLPTPNIFTGGHNFHGKYEYIPIQSMEKAVKTIVRIVQNLTKI